MDSQIKISTEGGLEEKIHSNDVDEEEGICEWSINQDVEDEDKASLMLVGKVWTGRSINANALMETLKKIWQPKYGMEARKLDEKLFSFQFFHWRDKRNVLEGQPWHFDRHVLCFSEIQDDGKPSEMQLHSLPIWVRFYNLPFKGRGNDENIKMLAGKVGVLVKIDKSNVMDIDRSVRVNVVIDVRKPLKEQVKMKIRGGEMNMVQVKYERLPLFCYICGKLGHGDKDCDELRGEGSPMKKYGSQLRASPWKPITHGRTSPGDEREIAKRLFVPKPKNDASPITIPVEVMAEKLGGVLIEGNIEEEQGVEGDASKEGREEGSEDEGEKLKAWLVEGKKSEEEQKEVVKHGRKWLRINRPQMIDDTSPKYPSGVKRLQNPREHEINSHEEQGNPPLKKKHCTETKTPDGSLADEDMRVAGPTQWALNGQ